MKFAPQTTNGRVKIFILDDFFSRLNEIDGAD
jgi:hypothetical protein